MVKDVVRRSSAGCCSCFQVVRMEEESGKELMVNDVVKQSSAGCCSCFQVIDGEGCCWKIKCEMLLSSWIVRIVRMGEKSSKERPARGPYEWQRYHTSHFLSLVAERKGNSDRSTCNTHFHRYVSCCLQHET